jgi:hypothetical protein
MSQFKSQVLFLVVLSHFLLWPAISLPQEWSNEQKEALAIAQKMEDCWVKRDLDGYMSCLHENFIGWFQKDPLPLNKESLRKWEKHWLSTVKIHLDEMKPVSITITGNIGIINLYASTIEEDENGKKLMYSRWTEILIKEDGKWLILGMHGGNMDDD